MIQFSANFAAFAKEMGVKKKEILDTISAEMDRQSKKMTSFVRKQFLSGGTSQFTSLGRQNTSYDRLRKRSGGLVKSTMPVTTTVNGNKVFGGIEVTHPYAHLHISDYPKETVIHPRTAKRLAVPLEGSPAVSSKGVQLRKGNIRAMYPNLKYFPANEQHPFPVLGKGTNKAYIPYFALLKSVTIHSKVNTTDVARKLEPMITKGFEDALK